MIDRPRLGLKTLVSISDEQAELPHHCAMELHGWMLTLGITACVTRWDSTYIHTYMRIHSFLLNDHL